LIDKDVPPDMDKALFFAELGKKISPMHRMGTPQDIAGVALFLASDLSDYVNGQQIIVAGGAPILIAPSGEEQPG
jgi:NAD(P)-dependent dehydrogenase (short-subunit alcohol dehydrogenase family)